MKIFKSSSSELAITLTIVLIIISRVSCADIPPSLVGRITSGNIPISTFFDPISQIIAVSSRFLFFSNATSKTTVTLGVSDIFYGNGLGSLMIGNSNPIELRTNAVELTLLLPGLQNVISTNGMVTIQDILTIQSHLSPLIVEGNGVLDIKSATFRCVSLLPATVYVANGGSIINSGRSSGANTAFTNLNINMNRGFLLLGQTTVENSSIFARNNSQITVEAHTPSNSFGGVGCTILVEGSSFIVVNALGSSASYDMNVNITMTQNSNFTVSGVSVTILGTTSIESGSVIYIIDSTLLFTQNIELYGTIFVAPNSTLVVYPAASISGNGQILNEGTTSILGNIGQNIRVVTNTITGTNNFGEVEFVDTTEVIDAYVTLQSATIDGTFNVKNGTFVGTNINFTSFIQVNYADLNVNEGKLQLQDINLLLSEFDSWMTFKEGANGKFINSNITVIQGFINLATTTTIEMEQESAIVISTNGHLRVGTNSRIQGNLLNYEGSIGSQWDNSTKDSVMQLVVNGQFVQTEGELVLRIAGYAENKRNSVIYVNSADIGGTVVFLNDEGLFPNQTFTIMQLNNSTGRISLRNNVIVRTTYREDAPMKLKVEDNKLIAYTDPTTPSKDDSSKLTQSMVMLLIILLVL